MKKYIVEFIGTFFFTLTVVMTFNNGSDNFAPLASGSVLMVMIYSGRHFSGGHFNPAISLAAFLRGKMDKADLPFYFLAQLVGAVVAGWVSMVLLRCNGAADISPRGNDGFCAVIAEFLGTFALAWVFLNVATTRANTENSHYGLSIGFTFLACSLAFGNISGGIFNPALAFGSSTANMTIWGDIWIYLLGDLLGAAAAATVFQVVYGLGD